MTTTVINKPPVQSASVKPPASRRSNGRTPGQRAITPWLYILPAAILVVGVIYVGIGYTGWVSTLNWNGIDASGRQVGFDNYIAAAEDPVLWQALGHVLVFGILTIVIQMVLGLIMAILLGSNAVFGRPIYKVVMFLPVVLAPAAVATAFRGILAPDGQFNGLLHALGISSANSAWLADPHFALYSIAAINIWQWTGFSFLLYQAAISQIDQTLFEAAAIDGAGTFKVVRYILLPQVRGTTATLALTGCIGALKTFDIVYLTTGGGPGRSTEFLTTYVYKQVIEQYHAGYSAALSIILLILALTLTAIQIRAYRFGED
ncbi:sugar ABC transporter permease [Glaciihabitans sp. UYNi722]|uniref:carbohydrate ABC transporter permease n=1 Tax=Glaciihabitans sp. UYNi722 TaxID=3156344 RepID=UPI00339ABBB4